MIKEEKLKKYIEEISMGPFGSDIKVDNYISDGIPVLNGSNLTSHKLVEESFNYVSEEKANSLGKANARRGDIVITHRGTLGQVSYIPFNSKFDRYIISQSQFRVRFNKNLDPIYFSYLMKSDYGQKKLLSFKNHVGVPALAQATTNFKDLEMFIHSLSDQQKIAKVLSDLDAKIELNNRINAELEGMAKLIYDYWFMQFDFPYDSAQAPGKPYKSSGGKMVWNEELKREVPEGWGVKRLHEIANITMGQSPEGSSYNNEGIGSVFFQGSTDFGWRFPTIRQFTTQPNRMASKGDILLSVRAPVGTLNIAAQNCCIGRGLAALNSKGGFDSYLFYVMEYFKKVFDNRNNTGTTFGSITKDDLYNLKLVYPSLDFLKKYDAIVSKFNQSIENNHIQNQELSALRDWLLPMLMNGQVRIEGKYEVGDGEIGMAAEDGGRYGL